jgi:diaminohydroxyphosphoribosylaminopyrimidine deaminase/5-amino-6-(5-phosphoribosylamino)uracil reductase
MTDPNPLVSGRGIDLLRGHGIEVRVGVMEAEARRLNAPFLTRIERHRPHVTMKIALSADGRVALPGGRPIRITADVADRHIQRDRAEVDAIAIGSGTLLQDDPRLTARGAFRRRPLVRAIFDRRLRTPPTARVLSTLSCGPVIIETSAAAATGVPERTAALEAAGATVHAVQERDAAFLGAALRDLAEGGISSVMLEGGPAVHRAFWDAGLVDRVQLYIGAIETGANGVPWWSTAEAISAALDDVRIVQLGPDQLIEGDVHRTD